MRVWIASLLFYSFIFTLCELLRHLVKRYVEGSRVKYHKLVITVAYEFIGTVQVCAPMFDVNLVLDNYGLQGVFFEIALIEVVNTFLLRDAMADPCPLFHGLFKGRKSIVKVSILLAVQFIAGYTSYLITRMFWSLGLHRQHLLAVEDDTCSADLTVTILYGSAVEAAGLITAKVAEIVFEKHLLPSSYVTLACALASGVITVVGIHLTGMYANPIVAWACTFNCGEVSHLAHFCVYWLAPFCAFTLMDKILPSGNEEKVKESEAKTTEIKRD